MSGEVTTISVTDVDQAETVPESEWKYSILIKSESVK
jgi:hypothetical protein